MNKAFNPSAIEKKWQDRWDESGIYNTKDNVSGRKNWFALTMFPYPSGDVHIGHWYAFAPADAHARFMRMEGFNVMQPQGFDAFGLPAENAAIQNNIHPQKWTFDNIDNMRQQFKSMGNAYDWTREVVTCTPQYYRWNQLFFLDFLRTGLAYRADALANWCPSCQTTLANEQVKEGLCERCDSEVTKRRMPQWFFKITKYADELLNMDSIEWPENIKSMQRNWIGRSEGASVEFRIKSLKNLPPITTFTTRIDTIYGANFIVLAPENKLVSEVTTEEYRTKVEEYIQQVLKKSEIERGANNKEKSGIFTGSYAINPANGESIPIFIADYVLSTYGSGAVMGVPAHDQRDFEFAKKYHLNIPVVVVPHNSDTNYELQQAYAGEGIIVNSGEFNGLTSQKFRQIITKKAQSLGWGKSAVTYKIRDWLISRQRYWGTPIPIVYCEQCGVVPVPKENIPVLLPDDASFKPTGESPLRYHSDFVNTICPTCKRPARRETDTMDTFVDSSWYHLWYTNTKRDSEPFTNDGLKAWMPVDQYMGGAEHAVMHLLYARFFNKALRDLGYLQFDEPYTRLFNQGILIREGAKISKRSNPLTPQTIIEEYGVDTVRCYLMFLSPWEQGGNWSDRGIKGIERWIKRVWALVADPPDKHATPTEKGVHAEKTLTRLCHSTTKAVVADMRAFKFNTSIASLMNMTNQIIKLKEDGISYEAWKLSVHRLLKHIAPLAPYIAEELWHMLGNLESIHLQTTPTWDEALLEEQVHHIVIQVNGKVRDRISVPAGTPKSSIISSAKSMQKIVRHINNSKIIKEIYVENRIVNFVLK